MIEVNYMIGHEDPSDIIRGFVSKPDNAGGNSIRYDIKNCGEKPIKYYELFFTAQNAVGDSVADSMTNLTLRSGKGTGPIARGGVQKNNVFRGIFYNSSVVRATLVKADIEYMDGTHEEIDGSQIKPIKSGAGFNPAIIGITLFVIAMILVSIYFML